jgi:hypothetical protein
MVPGTIFTVDFRFEDLEKTNIKEQDPDGQKSIQPTSTSELNSKVQNVNYLFFMFEFISLPGIRLRRYLK